MRMSASSSTIRTSCAMADRAQFHGLIRSIETLRSANLRRGKMETNAGALRVPILQSQLSMMIFHDLLDDGQTKACALCPRRNIGLGQLLAPMLRQPLPVVFDNHGRLAVLLQNRPPDASCPARAALPPARFDRFDRILDDIDQRLANQARITVDH